jgi:hypothetical protein
MVTGVNNVVINDKRLNEAMQMAASDGCNPYNTLPEVMTNYAILQRLEDYDSLEHTATM